LDSGEQIASFAEESRHVSRVLLSDNGKIVVLGSFYEAGYDRSISIFEVQSSRELDVIRQRPYSLPFAPMEVIPSNVFQLLITPLLKGDYYPSMQYCFLSPDGNTLVFDDPWRFDKWVIYWDVSQRRIRQKSDQLPSAFSPMGEIYDVSLATLDEEGNWQGETIVRDVKSRRIIARIPLPASDFVFSPDGSLFAAEVKDAHGRREVKVWNVASSQEIATLVGGFSPTFSRNGKRLAVRDLDLRNIKVWDANTWREVHELNRPNDNEAKGLISHIIAGPGDEDFRAVVFDHRNSSANPVRQRFGQFFGFSPSAGKGSTDLRIVDVATGKIVFELNLDETPWLAAQTEAAPRVSISPDGRTLVLESPGKTNSDGSRSVQLFSIPPDRQIMRIVLWPFVVALLVVFAVGRIQQRKRLQKTIETSTAGSQLN
jgi:WD40 repeat protein